MKRDPEQRNRPSPYAIRHIRATRYRRLNTIFDRTKEHLTAFIEIAFVSILSRRLKRLATDVLSA
jgi:hypothetical protein